MEMILKEKEHYIEIDIKMSDGTIIGTAEIEPNEKMLERFVIFEPYQNKGYGQQVLLDLINTYEIRKLWVRSDNDKAIHIYKKAGFIVTKETMYEMERHEVSSIQTDSPASIENDNKIYVGDIVKHNDFDKCRTCIVTKISKIYGENMATLVTFDGHSYYASLDELKRTGKHVDLENIMKKVFSE